MFFTCRWGSGSLDVPVGQTPLLYKEVPELHRRALARATGRLSGAFSPRTRRSGPEPAGGRMWGLLVNPTALIPVTPAWRSAAGPGRAAGPTRTGRHDLGGDPPRLQPRPRDVPRVLRPGRESDALGRAGRELPGLAGRGREVVLHGGSPPGGHQSSDPGGGPGRVDGGRDRRFHQRCERCAAAWQPHRQLAHPGAGAGTALAARTARASRANATMPSWLSSSAVGCAGQSWSPR